MDLKEVKSLLEEDSRSDNKKCCADCKTTKTPLWRGGPAGPKSLCNACGIRHRKKRRLITSLEKRPDKKRQRTHLTIVKKSTPKSTTATATTIRDAAICDKSISGGGGSGNDNHQLSDSLKMNLMVALGEKVMLQRSSSAIVKKQRCQRRRRLGEEEQAAFCLMALSCGSVSA